MKITIKFLGPLAREDKIIDIQNSQELKDVIKNEIDNEWLESVAIAINDKIVNSLESIKDGDVISILPPVCGG